eukprot:jgi/Chlat1/2599/Chrsp178S02496
MPLAQQKELDLKLLLFFVCNAISFRVVDNVVSSTLICSTSWLHTAKCYVHSFFLVMGSCMSHHWAKRLITNAQEVVTYFKAAHKPLALLKMAAKADGIIGTLYSSNKTRFTSVCRVHAGDIKNGVVMDIVRDVDREFWDGLGAIDKLLQPFTKVIMAAQCARTTLADVTRYWLYLAQQLKTLASQLPRDFKENVI